MAEIHEGDRKEATARTPHGSLEVIWISPHCLISTLYNTDSVSSFIAMSVKTRNDMHKTHGSTTTTEREFKRRFLTMITGTDRLHEGVGKRSEGVNDGSNRVSTPSTKSVVLSPDAPGECLPTIPNSSNSS